MYTLAKLELDHINNSVNNNVERTLQKVTLYKDNIIKHYKTFKATCY